MSEPKKRGRPREFDLDEALDRATTAFLRHGYSGASVVLLAQAMQLSKPSLYGAFGDKRTLYLRVAERIARARGARYRAAFEHGDDLEAALRALFEEVIEVTSAKNAPPGCLIASSATTEAVEDTAIAEFTRAFFVHSDKAIAAWARAKLPADAALSADSIGRLINAMVHDISLRARVGEPRPRLRELAREAATALARAATTR